MFHRRRPATTTTRSSKPTLMTRLRGPNAKSKTVKTKTTTTRHGPSSHRTTKRHWGVGRPVQHHRRKTTLGDKLSGAMLKLKGSLMHRPAVKVSVTQDCGDAAFLPKTFTIRLQKGTFTQASSKHEIYYTYRLNFDKSPYPPAAEWKEAQCGHECWTRRSFTSGKYKKVEITAWYRLKRNVL
ncbi:hypothetical protein N7532_001082 [Penicillium argentinense]|uniref:Uncharacterized protein n=1 Tax=Penicillium argentinense TaxID=1131581 RepID=A0A9W9G1W7_9EURO|nr:uncharacterized protein N7532_001082 [Penicillium argentinense]KAJ5110547.1 hypothetical protein N7532_001082 [Penicillium argentinense]